MKNKEYVAYLNTLHNFRAQNQNAYAEKNVNNQFFKNIMVDVPLCDYIEKNIREKQPHMIILTGHAGDGKTSLMYQVLKRFGIEFQADKKFTREELEKGRACWCIKDFSELSDDEKLETLEQAVRAPQQGDFVFMVANTGPLINTFGQLFTDAKESEDAKIKLINAMDSNSTKVNYIGGYPICVINVAAVDNTYFATEFVNKLIKEELWNGCETCSKIEYCHIKKNRDLIKENKERVFDFLEKHYIWLLERGERLTIRSMTEQLVFMITGAVNCNEVKRWEEHMYLFSNLFFGYLGLRDFPGSEKITAIQKARECGYASKRMRIDEQLILNADYNLLFSNTMSGIMNRVSKRDAKQLGWTEFARRAYIFMNIQTDNKQKSKDMEDLFSRQYERYLALRNGSVTSGKEDVELIAQALSMMYTGSIKYSGRELMITLNRGVGVLQNVQFVIGTINISKIKIKQEEVEQSIFEVKKHYKLKLIVEKKDIDCELSLPIINYFDEVRNGVIETVVDPQLSYGVENIKTKISRYVEEENDESEIEIMVMKSDGPSQIRLEICDDKIRVS